MAMLCNQIVFVLHGNELHAGAGGVRESGAPLREQYGQIKINYIAAAAAAVAAENPRPLGPNGRTKATEVRTCERAPYTNPL